MATRYIHRLVIIESETPSLSHPNLIQLTLPSMRDWSLNLKSILKRIPNKLNIPNIDKSQLLLSINGVIINKQDPNQFGKLLSSIKPPAIIKVSQISVNLTFHDFVVLNIVTIANNTKLSILVVIFDFFEKEKFIESSNGIW